MRIIEFHAPTLTDVFCPEVGWTVARDGFCYDCGATDHQTAIKEEKEMTSKKAEDLEHGDRIIDPEGNEATVIRLRRMDHQRGRLETDLGVKVVPLSQKFPLAP